MTILVSMFFLFIINSILFGVHYLRKLRFNNFLNVLNNKSYINYSPDQLEIYSQLIKKHFLRDNILNVFVSYYPDKIFTEKRIEKMLSLYLFDRNVNELAKYTRSTSPYHQTVNSLTKRIINMYVLDDDYSEQLEPRMWNDLSNIEQPTLFSTILTLKEWSSYLLFYTRMIFNGFICVDVNSDTRLWIHRHHKFEDTRIVILNNQIKLDFNKSKKIYVEIKGFSQYADFYDTVSCDKFNNYCDLDQIARKIGNVFDLISRFKTDESNVDLELSGSTTILVPYILTYYKENIRNVFITDPVFYPYSFHSFFNFLPDRLSYNFINMFHNLSLMKLYIDSEDSDKFKGIFNNNIYIHFTESFENADILTCALSMHSKVNIDKC